MRRRLKALLACCATAAAVPAVFRDKAVIALFHRVDVSLAELCEQRLQGQAEVPGVAKSQAGLRAVRAS